MTDEQTMNLTDRLTSSLVDYEPQDNATVAIRNMRDNVLADDYGELTENGVVFKPGELREGTYLSTMKYIIKEKFGDSEADAFVTLEKELMSGNLTGVELDSALSLYKDAIRDYTDAAREYGIADIVAFKKEMLTVPDGKDEFNIDSSNNTMDRYLGQYFTQENIKEGTAVGQVVDGPEGTELLNDIGKDFVVSKLPGSVGYVDKNTTQEAAQSIAQAANQARQISKQYAGQNF